MKLLKFIVVLFGLIFFTLSCTDDSVSDDDSTGNISEYVSHSFLLFTNETIAFQTNEYVKASWENRNSFFIEIDTLDTSGLYWHADWYINTFENYIEFPSNISQNDDYTFSKSATYSIRAWSYHTSDEIRNDQSTVVETELIVDVNDTTKDTTSVAIICIVGKDCTDSTNIKKLSDDNSKYIAIDSLFEVVGYTFIKNDSGEIVDTIDVIDTFFVLSNKDYKIKKEIRVISEDTLTFYNDDSATLATFTFKDLFLPSPKITSVTQNDTSLSVSLSEDSTDSFVVIIEDLLTTNVSSAKIKGNKDAAFSNIVKNSVYKISAVVDYGNWLGESDSIYPYGEEGLILPYKYYSTFNTPAPLADSSFIPVKGGIFIMGDIWESDFSSYSPGARPAHEVIVSSFYLKKNEITVGEYVKFLDRVNNDTNNLKLLFSDSSLVLNGHKLAYINNSFWNISIYTDALGKVENLSVVDSTISLMSVTWEGAVAYCNWLSSIQETPLDNCYEYYQNIVQSDTINFWKFNKNANGFRLPSEAEWEYVASQATDSTKNKLYEDSIFVNLSDQAEEWVTDVNDKLFGELNDSSSFYKYSLSKGVVVDPCNRNRDRKGNISRGGGLNSSSYEKQSFYRHFNINSWNMNAGFRVARNN